MKRIYILAVAAIVVVSAITVTVKVLKAKEGNERPEVRKEENEEDYRITPEKLQELKEKFGAK